MKREVHETEPDEQESKKLRFIPHTDKQDDNTVACATIANRETTRYNMDATGRPQPARRMKMIDLKTREQEARKSLIRINVHSMPLEDFEKDHPKVQLKPLDETPEEQTTITAETFPDLVSPVDILNKQKSFWARRYSKTIH